MLPTVVVPVRIEPVAKRRLAHLVGADDRRTLVEDLFDHVVSVVADAGLRVVVLAPHAVDVGPDVELWHDEEKGLNRALARAIERTGVPVLIVHADLPALHADDVWALVDAPGEVVIARATDGGTNALLLRADLRPDFGPGSALAFAQRARAAGLRATVIDRPGLALEVDDAAGLTASSWQPPSSSSRRRLP